MLLLRLSPSPRHLCLWWCKGSWEPGCTLPARHNILNKDIFSENVRMLLYLAAVSVSHWPVLPALSMSWFQSNVNQANRASAETGLLKHIWFLKNTLHWKDEVLCWTRLKADTQIVLLFYFCYRKAWISIELDLGYRAKDNSISKQ